MMVRHGLRPGAEGDAEAEEVRAEAEVVEEEIERDRKC